MPKKLYSLLKDGPKDITVDTGWTAFSKIKILYAGKQVAEFTQNDLQHPQEVNLESNPPTKISFRIKRFLKLMPELEILKDDKPLEGSATDPKEIIHQIFYLTLFVAGVNILAGIFGLLGPNLFSDTSDADFTGVLIFIGLIFALLGFWLKKTYSIIPLITILVLLITDSFLTIASAGESTGGQSGYAGGGIFLRLFILIYLFRGFSAIKKIKEVQHSK